MTLTDERFDLPAFEGRLWDELAALHAEARSGVEVRSAGRHARRRIYAAAVAALAAAAAVTALVLVDRGGSRINTSDTPPVPDAIVVRTSVHRAGYRITYWIDDTTEQVRSLRVGADGQPQTEDLLRYEPVGDGRYARVTTDVDHSTHSYRESSSADGDPPTLFDVRQNWESAFAPWSAPKVADAVEVVDGRELLRVDPTNPLVCAEEPCGGRLWSAGDTIEMTTVWLDPATLRTVRTVSEQWTMTQEVIDNPDLFWNLKPTVEETATYEYLPRTPENIALTEITIPEGYTEVEPDQ